MINLISLQKDLQDGVGGDWNVSIVHNPYNEGFNVEVYKSTHYPRYQEEVLSQVINDIRQSIFSLKPVIASTKYFNEEIDRLKKEVEELQKYKIYFELEKELRNK